jgi:hypothetical protein
MKCNGEETHRHFQIATGTFIEHTHHHIEHNENSSRLHHHSPMLHAQLSHEELMKDFRDTGEGIS